MYTPTRAQPAPACRLLRREDAGTGCATHSTPASCSTHIRPRSRGAGACEPPGCSGNGARNEHTENHHPARTGPTLPPLQHRRIDGDPRLHRRPMRTPQPTDQPATRRIHKQRQRRTEPRTGVLRTLRLHVDQRLITTRRATRALEHQPAQRPTTQKQTLVARGRSLRSAPRASPLTPAGHAPPAERCSQPSRYARRASDQTSHAARAACIRALPPEQCSPGQSYTHTARHHRSAAAYNP